MNGNNCFAVCEDDKVARECRLLVKAYYGVTRHDAGQTLTASGDDLTEATDPSDLLGLSLQSFRCYGIALCDELVDTLA